MPGKWLSSAGKDDLVSNLCSSDSDQYFKEHLDNHYEQLYRVIDILSMEVQQELHYDKMSGKLTDTVDNRIQELEIQRKFKNCPKCNYINDKSKRKCIHCQSWFSENSKEKVPEGQTKKKSADLTNIMYEFNKNTSEKTEDERYGYVKSAHARQPKEIILLEPVFVNPNSTENIILVLRHIGKKAEIARYFAGQSLDTRQWTFVCCDGLPHGIVRKLIEEYLVCSECGVGCLGIEQFEKHNKSVHKADEGVFYHEFDWVFLVSGDGHFEMNLMKSFVKLNWNVFMKVFVDVMGFKSEKGTVGSNELLR